jgi:hypothetical protein
MNRRLALSDLEHEVSVAGSIDSVAVPPPVIVAAIIAVSQIAVAVITKPK